MFREHWTPEHHSSRSQCRWSNRYQQTWRSSNRKITIGIVKQQQRCQKGVSDNIIVFDWFQKYLWSIFATVFLTVKLSKVAQLLYHVWELKKKLLNTEGDVSNINLVFNSTTRNLNMKALNSLLFQMSLVCGANEMIRIRASVTMSTFH